MPTASELDSITITDLRASRATKWSRPDGAIGAFIAEMDYGTAPAVVNALQAEAVRGAFGYLSAPLAEDLRNATVPYLEQRYGWAVPPRYIHPVPDVLTALATTIRQFTTDESPVIVPTPAYMHFFTVIRELGRDVVEVPMITDHDGRFHMDLPAIAHAFASTGSELMILCNPHNPSGRVFSSSELHDVAQVVDTAGGRVFADEIWAPLTYLGRPHIPYASICSVAASHSVTAMAASKGWNVPGLKCAQVILSNDPDLEIWSRVGAMAGHGTATLGVVGTIAAYTDGMSWLDDIVTYLEENARLVAETVAERMPRARFSVPEGTYVAWIDLSAYGLEGGESNYLLERAAVLPTDGTTCGRVGEGCIRFNFAMPRPVLRQALDRIAGALENEAVTGENPGRSSALQP